MSAVAQIEVPAAARELSGIPRVDYADAFRVGVGATGGQSAEQWARRILEGAPVKLRDTLRSGWAAIGLKLVQLDGDRAHAVWARVEPDHVRLVRRLLESAPRRTSARYLYTPLCQRVYR